MHTMRKRRPATKHLQSALSPLRATARLSLQVQAALEQYRLLAKHTRDILLFLQDDGRIMEANRAAEFAYGYERSQLLGRSFRDLCEPQRVSETEAVMAAPELREASLETVHRRADGTTFPVEVDFNAVDVAGRRRWLWVVRDITQRRRTELMRELLRAVDHRILQNQPMDDTLQYICNQLTGVFNVLLVWLGTREADGSVKARARAGVLAGSDLELAEVLTGDQDRPDPIRAAVATCRPQSGRVAEPADPAAGRDGARALGIRSYLVLPLVARDEVLGVLALYSAQPEALISAGPVADLQSFSKQVALALLAARHQEQIILQTVALESAANAVIITDRNGRIHWVNPAFTRLTGYTPQEAIGDTPRMLKSGQHSESFYQELWETILAGRTWRSEVYNRRKDGSLYIDEQTITPVRDATGDITHFITIKQDVTDRKRQEERIRHLVMYDPLTGLPNRHSLQQGLERVVSRCSRSVQTGALLLLDLDEFKVVNDTLGHPAGDQLLTVLAPLMGRCLRPGDLLARLGGDEFAVLLAEADLSTAKDLAECLRREVDEFRFHTGGQILSLSVSIGVTQIDGSLDVKTVLSLADAALYTAKETGKNRVVVHRPDDLTTARQAQASHWITYIKDALREGRFILHFQPVVRIGSGKAEHFEALVRLRGEAGEIIPPGVFIPLAERFGLVSQIDRWVITSVLELLQARPELKIFVNLSGRSLGDESLLEFVETRIRASGITPGHLALEITETAAVTDLAQVQHWMSRLRDLGCRFALDDFGTGFSSFSYLQAIPADYVKIDGSFVRNLDTDPTSRAIVQAINTVAHTLGKEVIAEWVESASVAGILHELGVEFGQGYFWGLPGVEICTTTA